MTAMAPFLRQRGLTLIELLVAMFLTAFLLLGLVKLVSAAGASTMLQDNQASLQNRVRFAGQVLAEAIASAGFSPAPWNTDLTLSAIGPQTADAVSASGDRLALQAWSDLNCFDNRNPDIDGNGQPRFYIRESVFDLNSTGYLTRTCRYGPSPADLVLQVRRQGLVAGVEAFQVLYGEDGDLDGSVDRWVRAGQWSDERQVMGVRAGLLVAGDDEVRQPAERVYRVLDATPRTRRDGRLREAAEFSLAIRGRVR